MLPRSVSTFHSMLVSPPRLLSSGMGLLALSVAACGRPAPEVSTAERELVVFAAASLREVFTTLGERFRAEHPEAEIRFNFAGTQELRSALEQGASADVFAAADELHMGTLAHSGQVGSPTVFARNELVLIVSREGAKRIPDFAHLPEAHTIVLGDVHAPIGYYSAEVLARAGQALGADFPGHVQAHVVSREMNTRGVLTKVALGEADAGIVYRTDVAASPDAVITVPIPPPFNVVATYPIARVKGAQHPRLAQAWIHLVTSSEGRTVLQSARFQPPPVGQDAP